MLEVWQRLGVASGQCILQGGAPGRLGQLAGRGGLGPGFHSDMGRRWGFTIASGSNGLWLHQVLECAFGWPLDNAYQVSLVAARIGWGLQ